MSDDNQPHSHSEQADPAKLGRDDVATRSDREQPEQDPTAPYGMDFGRDLLDPSDEEQLR